MIETYLARIAALIEASGIRSGVGKPPDNLSPPFTFVWGPIPIEDSVTAAGCDEMVDLEFHVQIVHDQSAQVLLLAGQVKKALADQTINIAGWRTFPIKLMDSTPVQTARAVIETTTNQDPAWATLNARFRAVKE